MNLSTAVITTNLNDTSTSAATTQPKIAFCPVFPFDLKQVVYWTPEEFCQNTGAQIYSDKLYDANGKEIPIDLVTDFGTEHKLCLMYINDQIGYVTVALCSLEINETVGLYNGKILRNIKSSSRYQAKIELMTGDSSSEILVIDQNENRNLIGMLPSLPTRQQLYDDFEFKNQEVLASVASANVDGCLVTVTASDGSRYRIKKLVMAEHTLQGKIVGITYGVLYWANLLEDPILFDTAAGIIKRDEYTIKNFYIVIKILNGNDHKHMLLKKSKSMILQWLIGLKQVNIYSFRCPEIHITTEQLVSILRSNRMFTTFSQLFPTANAASDYLTGIKCDILHLKKQCGDDNKEGDSLINSKNYQDALDKYYQALESSVTLRNCFEALGDNASFNFHSKETLVLLSKIANCYEALDQLYDAKTIRSFRGVEPLNDQLSSFQYCYGN